MSMLADETSTGLAFMVGLDVVGFVLADAMDAITLLEPGAKGLSLTSNITSCSA